MVYGVQHNHVSAQQQINRAIAIKQQIQAYKQKKTQAIMQARMASMRPKQVVVEQPIVAEQKVAVEEPQELDEFEQQLAELNNRKFVSDYIVIAEKSVLPDTYFEDKPEDFDELLGLLNSLSPQEQVFNKKEPVRLVHVELPKNYHNEKPEDFDDLIAYLNFLK